MKYIQIFIVCYPVVSSISAKQSILPSAFGKGIITEKSIVIYAFFFFELKGK